MAGGNFPKASSNKPSSSSSGGHRKSRWESGNKHTATTTSAAAPKQLPPPPPPPKSKPPPNPKDTNPPPKPSPKSRPGPSPSGPPFFQDNLGPPPPPAYGFHMLDRQQILMADGSVRSYFALPPDYKDLTFLPPGGQRLRFDPVSPKMSDSRDRNHEYWNSLENNNHSLKRKYVEEKDDRDRDEFARQRQQLLAYGNVGASTNNPNGHLGYGNAGGSSSGSYMGEDVRASKFMRGDRGGHNVVRTKHFDVDQVALRKAFLHLAKVVYENGHLKNSCLADGKQGALQCVVCGRASKDFPDMHALILHTYNPDRADLLVDHLGLHKVLCVLMGWNYSMPPDNSKAYQLLSADEAVANQDDLIMWPPMLIIHNTITGKSRDGRVEGLGNKAMDSKLRDLGFGVGKSKSLYGREGHLGITLVKYAGDQSGLSEAIRLADFFEKENHGRRSWAVVQNLVSTKDGESNPNLVRVDKHTGEKERVLYGYLATVCDIDKVDFETRKKVVIESRRECKSLK